MLFFLLTQNHITKAVVVVGGKKYLANVNEILLD